MKYTWRIYRYSRFNTYFSECNTDLRPLGQTITRTKYGPKDLVHETWLHIYSTNNKLIELSLADGALKITLRLVSVSTSKCIVLEKLVASDEIKFCVKQRTMGCKSGLDWNRKFQVTFYSVDEVDLFSCRFGNVFGSFVVIEDRFDSLKQQFLQLVSGEKFMLERTDKSREELLKKFFSIVE